MGAEGSINSDNQINDSSFDSNQISVNGLNNLSISTLLYDNEIYVDNGYNKGC
jgi:hypothetical protein